ncbi:MAG: hypothetical protein A2Z20_09720 [Bdellovibrionales bacterium RBG_16_40_8]|nr:MAG: hypothetical protein A2Z20_09720 [Bdellovibrionales bacterium RBG_16_40_8]
MSQINQTNKSVRGENKFDGYIKQIVLCAPPANVLTSEVMAQITAEIEQAVVSPKIKAIVFTAEGAHFSYGASVEEHLPGKVEKMLPQFHRFIDGLLNIKTPTFSKVSGLCLGGAFEMVMATNFIFCDESARMGVPEIQLGVFPPAACALLPILAPPALASRMILTGQRINADELKAYGLVTHVAKSGALDTDLDVFLEKNILPKSAEALRHANYALRTGIRTQYKNFIEPLERQYLQSLMSTHDAAEGLNAFIQKRNPEWKNN